MAVDPKELASALRQRVRRHRRAWTEDALASTELLAEAVEYFGSSVFTPSAWTRQWLRRVAEAHAEGGDDGS